MGVGRSSSRTTQSNPPGEGAGRQTAVVFGGNIATTAMGFVANICIMRAVGPSGFGVVIVSTTVLTILWLLTGRGVDQALVRCVSQKNTNGDSPTPCARATVHQIKLAVGAAVALAGALAAKPLTLFLLGPDVSSAPLCIGALSSLAASLWGYTGASLQAAKSFNRFAVVQMTNSGIRLGLVVALVACDELTATWAMVATGAGYSIAALIGYALSVPATRKISGSRALRPVIFDYSKWLVISSLIHIFYTRIDHLMLSRMAGADSAGVFGAAVNFIQIVDLLTFSLLTVWLPRFCETTDILALRRHAKKALGTSLALAVLMMPAYFLARPVIGWILGDAYRSSIDLFKVIFVGAVVTLITHPLQGAVHARGKTHLLTGLDLGLLGLNVAFNYWVIPRYGVSGAAGVALGTRILGGVVLSVVVARILRRGPHDLS